MVIVIVVIVSFVLFCYYCRLLCVYVLFVCFGSWFASHGCWWFCCLLVGCLVSWFTLFMCWLFLVDLSGWFTSAWNRLIFTLLVLLVTDCFVCCLLFALLIDYDGVLCWFSLRLAFGFIVGILFVLLIGCYLVLLGVNLCVCLLIVCLGLITWF